MNNLVSTLWSFEQIRFIAVGILNTIFGYSVYALLIFLSVDYKVSIFIATMVGAVFNFFSIGQIVFYNKSISPLLLFFLAFSLIYIINVELMKALLSIWPHKYAGQALLLPALAALSFGLNKYFVFGRGKNGG